LGGVILLRIGILLAIVESQRYSGINPLVPEKFGAKQHVPAPGSEGVHCGEAAMPDTLFATTPDPPYYAVIFTSLRTPEDDGYGETAGRMTELAVAMPGYLGFESARGPDGVGITVSYWESEEAIANWKCHAEHLEAQRRGKTGWYGHYELRVARVERAYSGPEGR
jgi:heme-degrading monooxygenase HmoA